MGSYLVMIVFVVVLQLLANVWNNKVSYGYEKKWVAMILNVLLAIMVCSKLSTGVYGFLLCTLFVALINVTFIDFKYMEIPDSYNLLIVILGLINILLLRIYPMFVTGVLCFVIFFILSMITGGAVGGGDIKLSLGIGFFFTISMMGSFFMYTFGIGAVIALVLMITKIKSRQDKIPFGPFIALGTIITIYQLII